MAGLAGYATLLTATRALRGKTYAGNNVLMSPRGEIEIASPTICVYASHGEAKPRGRDLQAADGDLTLRIELFAPEQFTAVNGAATLTFTQADSAESMLGLWWFQCLRALLFEQDTWPALFRRFCLGFTRMVWQSDIFKKEDGTKVVARVIELTCAILNEPSFASAPEDAWSELLDAMGTSTAETQTLGSFIAAELAAPSGAPQWRILAAQLGVTQDELMHIGDGPMDLSIAADPAAAQQVTLEDTDIASGDPQRGETLVLNVPASGPV